MEGGGVNGPGPKEVASGALTDRELDQELAKIIARAPGEAGELLAATRHFINQNYESFALTALRGLAQTIEEDTRTGGMGNPPY